MIIGNTNESKTLVKTFHNDRRNLKNRYQEEDERRE